MGLMDGQGIPPGAIPTLGSNTAQEAAIAEQRRVVSVQLAIASFGEAGPRDNIKLIDRAKAITDYITKG